MEHEPDIKYMPQEQADADNTVDNHEQLEDATAKYERIRQQRDRDREESH